MCPGGSQCVCSLSVREQCHSAQGALFGSRLVESPCTLQPQILDRTSLLTGKGLKEVVIATIV